MIIFVGDHQTENFSLLILDRCLKMFDGLSDGVPGRQGVKPGLHNFAGNHFGKTPEIRLMENGIGIMVLI